MLKEPLAQEDIINGEIDDEIGIALLSLDNEYKSRGKTSSVISCQEDYFENHLHQDEMEVYETSLD
jgi:hypothetical protein